MSEYYIDFNTKIDPGKIQAVKVTLELVTIGPDRMNEPLAINLCEDPLYKELKQYVEANQ
jgi:hypothetical protein